MCKSSSTVCPTNRTRKSENGLRSQTRSNLFKARKVAPLNVQGCENPTQFEVGYAGGNSGEFEGQREV